ncbi:unnamed protein product [Polarella glacialis]|uniref:Uncharacterized protein n=1 Tax=Polarella glacialis TaxID=89957 RepID=A0A813GTN3_POLGL|nr:unnamed protein product [Polarella glacialis]
MVELRLEPVRALDLMAERTGSAPLKAPLKESLDPHEDFFVACMSTNIQLAVPGASDSSSASSGGHKTDSKLALRRVNRHSLQYSDLTFRQHSWLVAWNKTRVAALRQKMSRLAASKSFHFPDVGRLSAKCTIDIVYFRTVSGSDEDLSDFSIQALGKCQVGGLDATWHSQAEITHGHPKRRDVERQRRTSSRHRSRPDHLKLHRLTTPHRRSLTSEATSSERYGKVEIFRRLGSCACPSLFRSRGVRRFYISCVDGTSRTCEHTLAKEEMCLDSHSPLKIVRALSKAIVHIKSKAKVRHLDVNPGLSGGLKQVEIQGSAAVCPNVSISVAGCPSDGNISVDEGNDLDSEDVRVQAARDYAARHQVELRLAEAMKALMKERPEKALDFLAAKLLQYSSPADNEAPRPYNLSSGA